MTSLSTELGPNFSDVIPQFLVALRDSTRNRENRPAMIGIALTFVILILGEDSPGHTQTVVLSGSAGREFVAPSEIAIIPCKQITSDLAINITTFQVS